ncbi:hypothetical protein Ddye_019586 [Dipteronia dyeriana]|uniref:Gnk2-homologous domain-containing protein n=1 Tax=Dipteronia dyeriana TaxID=168575 RepID=A0AAD9TYH7_9ROSI|nr:hypothetical protein Ddye_019586 [Dipteronia dyeriana]
MAIFVLSAPTTIQVIWLLSYLSVIFMSQSSLGDDQVQVHLIGWSCERSTNNTASNKYTFNLSRLFSRKLYDEGGNSVYYNTNDGTEPDKVYGLFLCRGDVTTQTCQICINAAIDFLVSKCQGTKCAITWYDECLVRYSNRIFSFTFESVPAVIMSNEDNLNVSDPVGFRKALNQSFTQLIANVNSNSSKFATNIVNISSSVALYTLGQCIPGLSKKDCRDCLDSAAQLVAYDKKGSRYLYPSCNARWELYPFFIRNSSIAAPEPTSPVRAPPPISDKTGGVDLGKNGKENRIWVPITISVSAGVILVVLFGFLLLHKNRRNTRAKANSQEVRLIRLREGRIGNDYSYDALQGENQMESQDLPMFPLDLTLEATQHFSDENKLGEGGFGPVYKFFTFSSKKVSYWRSWDMFSEVNLFANDLIVSKSVSSMLLGTLLLLHLLSFLSFAVSKTPDSLSYICPSDQNNTASGNYMYMYNVGQLFNRKPYHEDSKSIYYGEYPDKVYCVYLCRFDITPENCQNCIAAATDWLVQECNRNKTAIT